MSRHANTLSLFAVFCGSTAVLVWLLNLIFQDGALSLGAALHSEYGGPVFNATWVLFAAAVSIASGCVLIATFRDYLRDRRLKRFSKNRNP